MTKLIEPILNRVDNGSIPIIAAVEISYLTEQQQKTLFEFLLNHSDCKITTANARSIKDNPDDLEAVFYGKSDKSDLFKELADKEVDNLSTKKENHEPEQPVTAPKPSENKNHQPAEKDNTKVDKLSTHIHIQKHKLYYQDDEGNTFPVESVNKELLKVICEFVIDCTHVTTLRLLSEN